MDKYQEDLINGIRFVCYDAATIKTVDNPFQNNVLKIIQDEDIMHTKYFIYLENAKTVSKIELCKNEKYTNLTKVSLKNYSDRFGFNKEEFVIDIDFDSKDISKIKLYFRDDLAAPLEIPVEYVDADKDKYNEKVKINLQKELDQKANIIIKNGDGLINVNFKPVSDTFSYSKVELYLTEKNEYQIMAKYKTAEDVYFHSITGIAYGEYAVVLTQYDKDGNEIYKSDYLPVVLSRPNYSGKPIVRIG